MLFKNADGTISVKGASYELVIRGHRIDTVICGTAFASLDIRTAVPVTDEEYHTVPDTEPNIPVLVSAEILNGKAVLVWQNRSALWEKEYRLVCSYLRFQYYVKIRGKGRVDSVNYFSGNMGEPGYGSAYEFSEGFFPCRAYSQTETYRFGAGVTCYRPSILMTPPMFCYSFRCEGITERLALGLVAERGEHNFHSFTYQLAPMHILRAGFFLTTDQDGHTVVDGEWTAPYVIGYSATDDMNAMQKYSDYYYASGIAAPRLNCTVPRFWYGPLACGWIEQGSDSSACREEVYERMLVKLKKHDLHPTAVIIDDKWMKHYATYEADTEKWPDLRAYVDRHHAEGIRTMLWFMLWHNDGWDPDICVPGEQCALSVADDKMHIDPSHPRFIENLDRALERIFSDAEGCYNCDGLKLDFAFANPKSKRCKTYSGKYGVELMYDMMLQIYRRAKEIKPDALINNSVCHPYFGHICDQARLHDYFPTDRYNLEDLTMRGKMFSIAMPGVLLDTDNAGFVSRRDTMRWQLNQQIVGVPDLYNVSPTNTLDFNETDLAAIAEMWKEYAARIDAKYGIPKNDM